MKKKKKKTGNPSNNPNGRPKAEDPTELVGIYVKKSVIASYAPIGTEPNNVIKEGKNVVRDILKKVIEK